MARFYRKRYLILAGLAIGFLYWLLCLPAVLFPQPLATELLSTEGELLAARIAADGQWRMPPAQDIDTTLKIAVLAYEDRRFYEHRGVSWLGLLRAARENWRAGRIVSGGSTLTMQVARMARGNRARTLVQKLVEMSWATRLECRYPKEAILRLWLDHAPFGGNVVGIEAACRRYYGRSPAALSWAEAATLAVLPNSPGLIHPGRGRAQLRQKRDALLADLVALGRLDAATASLARLEPLPASPHPLPRKADHLLERLRADHGPGRYYTSLEATLQQAATRLVGEHQKNLAANQIDNVACLISEVATGRVLAYVGNTPPPQNPGTRLPQAPAVDIITRPRSPGSLLKPLLYGLALENGTIAPRQLLPDLPTSFGAFRPANFHAAHDGAVAADAALVRSLNIPFVHLLQQYGLERFHAALRQYGFRQITQPPAHYGLSLILGGSEITMEEIHAWLLGLARQQRFFHQRQGGYAAADFQPPTLLDHQQRPPLEDLTPTPGPLAAGAGFLTLESLRHLQRPDENGATVRFASYQEVAWKTGTSFGFRDAWAVGCTPGYVVSVWAGNADGQGRPGLVGVKAAAPLLFELFRLLQNRPGAVPAGFERPYDALRQYATCARSGYMAGPDCPALTLWAPVQAQRSGVCPYHQRIFLSPDEKYRVRQACGSGPPRPVQWFSLPPRQAYYYRHRHPDYRPLPPLHPDCPQAPADQPLAFIFPYEDGVLHPGQNWLGKTEPIHFELAHQQPETPIHWHLDENYLGTTTTFHTLALRPSTGRHRLTAVDAFGNRIVRQFEVR